MLDPDDTIQLGKYDADATLDGDATVDLMGMSSSPLKRAMAAGGVDDSLSFAFAGLGKQSTNGPGGDEDVEEEEEAYNGDETNQSTPRITRQVKEDERTPALPSEAPVSTSPLPEPEAKAPPQRAPPPVSPAEGKSYLASSASRLTSQIQTTLSPMKNSPDALQWVEEVRTGRATSATFSNLANMSRSYPVQTREDTVADEQLLQSGQGAYGSDEAAKRKMQEEEGAGDGDSLQQQQADAWRESKLFCKLWEALERSLLASFAAPASVGESVPPPPQAEDAPMAGLSLFYKLVENQYPLFLSYGLEVDLLSLIFKIRASIGSGSAGGSGSRRGATPPSKVISGCEALVDSWAARTLPALGLSSLLSSMGPAPSPIDPGTDGVTAPAGPAAGADSAASNSKILLLSLRALSRLLLRLPPEMVLEEVPRARFWILRALNDEHVTALRQAAVDVISCAQVRIEQGRGDEEEEGSGSASTSGAAGQENGGSANGSGRGGADGVEELFTAVGPLKQAQKDLLLYFIGQKRRLLAKEAASASARARIRR
jgi:hypothetical protein